MRTGTALVKQDVFVQCFTVIHVQEKLDSVEF